MSRYRFSFGKHRSIIGLNTGPVRVAAFSLCLLLLVSQQELCAVALAQDATDPVPVMAYYYIWFDARSWERAKIDYPVLGRYDSGSPEIMAQHVRWAKEAGIDGFIVSWKSTFQLDRNLEMLMDIALAEDFKLWIIYQGLDFDRQPLPLERVDADFEYFIERYAEHPVFDMYDKPVVIWSGTWEFTPAQVDWIAGYRDSLRILASERNVENYLRLAESVDGNAYYWSSVDPYVDTNFDQKLAAMGQAVHEHGGLWIAPAAPGFDARLIGGTRLVERHEGETLRRQMNAALRSSPDAVGLISWNEFSENTHIEPSELYGAQSLEVFADLQAGKAPQVLDFDSSAPGTTNPGDYYTFLVIGATVAVIIFSFAVVIQNSRKHSNADEAVQAMTLIASSDGVGARSEVCHENTINSSDVGNETGLSS